MISYTLIHTDTNCYTQTLTLTLTLTQSPKYILIMFLCDGGVDGVCMRSVGGIGWWVGWLVEKI